MRYFNRAKFTFTDTGTGNPSIYVVDGYDIPSINDPFVYTILHTGTSEYEHGIGYVTSYSPYVLNRTTVLHSSNSDALVSFTAGEKTLIGAVLAEFMPVCDYDVDSSGLSLPFADDGGTAVGVNTSSEQCSVSVGRSATSSGKSIALGYRASASSNSIAVGTNPDSDRTLNGAAASNSSIALGGGSVASKAIVVGQGAALSAGSSDPGRAGIAIGHNVSGRYYNESLGRPAVIIGDNAIGLEGGVTLGHDTKPNWPHTLTWGVGDDPGDGSAAQVQYTVSGGTVQTTDATATTLGFFCRTYNPATGIYTGAVLFQADIIGIDSSNNIAAIRITGTMRYGGIVGTPTVTSIGKSSALSTATAAVSYSSNSLYLYVTGVSGKTIRWGATVTATWIAPRF